MKTLNDGSQLSQRGVALAVSLTLHLAVLAAILWPATAAHSNDKNAEQSVEVRLIGDAGQLKPMVDILAERAPDKPAEGEPAKAAWAKCDGQTYTGIGVRAWVNGAILDVAADGPADKAGLRAGDTLLNFDAIDPDQHKPGTRITLRYLRGEREMPPVVAVVQEICNELAKPPEAGTA